MKKKFPDETCFIRIENADNLKPYLLEIDEEEPTWPRTLDQMSGSAAQRSEEQRREDHDDDRVMLKSDDGQIALEELTAKRRQQR